jgi:hypothetical protein
MKRAFDVKLFTHHTLKVIPIVTYTKFQTFSPVLKGILINMFRYTQRALIKSGPQGISGPVPSLNLMLFFQLGEYKIVWASFET